MLPSSNMPSILNSGTQKVAAAYSATIGLTYRFNRRGFKQASPYTVEDVMAYQAVIADRDLALAAVQADNAELANDLAAANKAAKKAAAEAAAAKKAAEMAKWGPNPIPADQLDGNAYTDDIYLTGKGITFRNLLKQTNIPIVAIWFFLYQNILYLPCGSSLGCADILKSNMNFLPLIRTQVNNTAIIEIPIISIRPVGYI